MSKKINNNNMATTMQIGNTVETTTQIDNTDETTMQIDNTDETTTQIDEIVTATTNAGYPASGPLPFKMTNDFLFKYLLQSDPDILKDIICSFYDIRFEDITNIIVTNPITLSENIATKEMILDIKAELNDDTIINLELQVVNFHDWPERSLSYLCRCFDNLPKGATYSSVKSAVHIGFLDYTLFPDNPEFFATYRLRDVKSGKVYSSKFQLSVVDLTKIDMATSEDKERKRNLWAAFFKAQSWEELYMLAEKDVTLKKAVTKVYQLSEEEKFRQQCQAREDFQRQLMDRDKYFNDLLEEQKEVLYAQAAELDAQATQLDAQATQLDAKDAELDAKNAELARYKQALIDAGIEINI